MRTDRRRPSLMLLLVIALLPLLPLFAFFQYRWLGEVSVGEHARMQTNLRLRAEGFTQEFDRELTNIFVRFQPSFLPSTPAIPLPLSAGSLAATNAFPDLANRYHQWLTSTKHAQFIDEIYQVKVNPNGQQELMRLNMTSDQLEPSEWPEKLAPVQLCLKPETHAVKSDGLPSEAVQVLRGLRNRGIPIPSEGRKEPHNFNVVLAFKLISLMEDIPALIVPQNGSPGILGLFGGPSNVPSYVIVTLNLDYIKTRYIPELAKSYFASDGTDDFIVTILQRGKSPKTIYQSDPRQGDLSQLSDQELAANDITVKFFKLQMEDLERGHPKFFIRQDRASVTTGSGQKTSSKFAISIFQRAQRNESLDSAQTGQIMDIGAQGAVKPMFDGVWQLVVKHRAGSLEAVVEDTRRRNLGISFGILLLLGTSVGLIVLSSRRAQRLAERQMEFVAGVSHELRTPLAVICSAAENLADGVIDNRDQIKQYGGLIRDEGRRLGGMVEQVLEFAGAQSGRKTYELRPTELDRVIEDAVAACHLQMIEGGFELEKQASVDLPLLDADAAALSRAIQNLLNNAMKYSGDNRWLRLSVEKVGQELQISVSDRGIGIPPAELARIFEPFYRGKEVMDAQIHGNGLGLSLVKHIVEAHGGRISVESKVGQGSSFTVVLPLCSEK